jgi:hypothetical protein
VEVLRQGADEDVLLLRDERDLLAEGLEWQVDEAHAAHLHRARARRVDSREEAPERRLARARRPDDRHALSRLEIEVDAVQHIPPLDVREADVAGAQIRPRGLLVARDPVGRHRGDPDEPRERSGADLDLVEPRDEAVDGVGELDGVEDDRGHLPHVRVARMDEPAAPCEGGDDGQHIGDLRRREPERPQSQRVPLGAVRLVEVAVDVADTLLVERERLDGEPAVDGLADRPRQRRIRGALTQVALRRPLEVPAGPDPERGDADHERECRRGAHPDRGRDRQRCRHRGDERLGDGEADRPRERVDVGGRARDEVAHAGALDRRQRQREDVAHEVLPELGEHPLREDEGRAPRRPGQRGLQEDEPGEHGCDPVDVRGRRPPLDRLDETAEQRRADEPGGRGQPVERDDSGKGARCLRAILRAWPRSSGPSAIGRSVAISRPPGG